MRMTSFVAALLLLCLLVSCGGNDSISGDGTENYSSSECFGSETDEASVDMTEEASADTTGNMPETVIGAKKNPKLPSMPEELWEHVYLTGRSNGNCLSLTGRAALLCVFANDDGSVWTEEAKAEAMKEFERGAEMIKSEAARYGAEAEIVLTYCEDTITYADGTVVSGTWENGEFLG